MQWIKITDSTEFPKEEVLVYTSTKTLFLAKYKYETKTWYETLCLDPITNVTHYMEIPQLCE